MEKEILRTTGNNFDGYYVDKYIDVISEEIVFKNSLLKQIVASARDFVGSFNILDSEVKGASNLIANGKKYVLEQLIKKAKEIGGNAILGMRFESSFGEALIRVAVSGTVVHIIPSVEKLSELNFSIKNSNNTPFRSSAVICRVGNGSGYISLDIYNPRKDNITGIICDIVFHTNFNDIHIIKDQVFINFEKGFSDHYVSEPIVYKIPEDIIKILTHADVMVKKYNIDNSTIEVAHTEINSKEDADLAFTIRSAEFDASETFARIQMMYNSKEIYEYILSLSEKDPNIIPLDLLGEIRNLAEIEKFYGNNKVSSIRAYEKKMGPFT